MIVSETIKGEKAIEKSMAFHRVCVRFCSGCGGNRSDRFHEHDAGGYVVLR